MSMLVEQVEVQELMVSDSFFTLNRARHMAGRAQATLRLTAPGGSVRENAEQLSTSVVELSAILATETSAAAITLEGFDGMPLEQKLKSGTLQQFAAIKILRGLASALDEMHSRGYVHASLRLHSLLVSDDFRVRLIDWAIDFNDLNQERSRELLGYASPEILLGEAATPAADQFALGAIAHHLLTGERPFAANTPMETVLRTMTGTWRNVEVVEAAAIAGVEAFDRVFSTEPSHRFSNCTQLVDTLERQLADAGRIPPQILTPAPSITPVANTHVEEVPGRWPTYAVRCAGLLALCAFALGTASWLTQRHLAAVEAQANMAAQASSLTLAENGRMKVCNTSSRPVEIRQLGVGYWDLKGHLQTFESSHVLRQGWTVASDSEQNLSWTPADSGQHPGGWDGSVLFYFLDIEQQGKQYILSGTWSDVDHGCLAIAPGQPH